jgi:hypothetical protein
MLSSMLLEALIDSSFLSRSKFIKFKEARKVFSLIIMEEDPSIKRTNDDSQIIKFQTPKSHVSFSSMVTLYDINSFPP